MLAYQQGDSLAFEVLYMRHKDKLFNFLYKSCQQYALVEDIAHDIWLSIIRSIKNYQSSASFKTYLYRIARNKLIDHWRQNKDSEEYEFNEQVHLGASIELDQEDASIKVQEILDKINQLPSEQREAFLLKEEGFSQQEIAEITNSKPETVKSRVRLCHSDVAIFSGGDEFKMSNRDKILESAFRKIQKVDSPKSLDQKILSESRRLAPEKQRKTWGGYTPMLATVCMVGVAIVIARPIMTTLETPAIKVESVANSQKAFKEKGVSIDRSVLLDKQVEESENLESKTVTENRAMSSAPASLVEKIIQPGLEGDVSVERQDDEVSVQALEAVSAPSAALSVRKKQDVKGLSFSSNDSAPEKFNWEESNLTEQAFNKMIDEIRGLIQQGEIDEANLKFEELKKNCPNCELPENVRDL